jgi:MFS family permease
LLSTVFVKAGLFVVGPSWVLFTVMGEHDFPVRWHGIDPQRGAMLGMSLLMGARGVGALLGPLLSAPWTGHAPDRLRLAILLGFLAEAAGYATLGAARSLWVACLCVIVAHFGGSIVYVFSTTLLQLSTDDRFRGRVFAADNGLFMLMVAVGAGVAGGLLDWGITARMAASAAGFSMLLPTLWWAWAMRTWGAKSAPAAEAAD